MTQTVAERLGHRADARLVIVNVDDLGFTHSVNRAFIECVDAGFVTSGSAMVPCPWFEELAVFARTRPDVDLGIHLTLTCECPTYRWGPILGAAAVPSLVRPDGSFPETEREVLTQADPAEVDAELRAQIDRAIAVGIQPTHLDSHMGVVYGRPDLFEVYLGLSRHYRLPIQNARHWWYDAPYLVDRVGPNELLLERVVSPGEQVAEGDWAAFYEGAVADLEPGVTEIGLHVGHDDDEMRGAYAGIEGWGAAWRQRDLEIALDAGWADRLAAVGAIRIGWRDLGSLLRRGGGA